MEAELREIRSGSDAMRALSGQVPGLQQTIEKLTGESEQLRKQLELCKEHEDEYHELKTKYEVASTSLKSLEDKFANTHSDLELTSNKRHELQAQLRILEKKSNTAEEMLSKLRATNGQMTLDLKTKTEAMANLSDRLEKERVMLRQSQEQLRKSQQDHHISATDQEKENAEQQLKLQTANDQVFELNNKVTELGNIMEALKKDVANANKVATNSQDILTRTKEYHEKEIERERRRLRLEKAGVNEKITTLEQEVATLKEELRDQKDANEGLSDMAGLQEKWNRAEKQTGEINGIVDKLRAAEERAEAAFICVKCTKLYTKPATCQPCGHSFCQMCVEGRSKCPECKVKVKYYPNAILDDLTRKHRYRKECLDTLGRLVKGNLKQ